MSRSSKKFDTRSRALTWSLKGKIYVILCRTRVSLTISLGWASFPSYVVGIPISLVTSINRLSISFFLCKCRSFISILSRYSTIFLNMIEIFHRNIGHDIKMSPSLSFLHSLSILTSKNVSFSTNTTSRIFFFLLIIS